MGIYWTFAGLNLKKKLNNLRATNTNAEMGFSI
jgi:hypothetical protein